jgi:ABC-2 type transport system permease protein
VAVVSNDTGSYSSRFISELSRTHHSFKLTTLAAAAAANALSRGEIVAVITIPADFSQSVLYGKDTALKVDVDNIDTDMTDDVQRALPSAIVAFGRSLSLPGLRVHVAETDLVDHDTDYIPYLVVSGLVLDSFVIAGILGAMVASREFETGTIRLLAASPVNALAPVLGRVSAANAAACTVMLIPAAIVVFAYGVKPEHPAAASFVLLLITSIFSCFGAALGAVLKRTLPVAGLVLGLSIPLYVCSGSLEPARFDGGRIWMLAHFSPVYYAVGLLENAFHGLKVTSESIPLDAAALVCWALVTLWASAAVLRKQLS